MTKREPQKRIELDQVKIAVTLTGISDLMFDRFIDHSKTDRPPEQKLYLTTGNKMIIPSENLDSFLFGMKPPPGCTAKFEGKEGQNYSAMGAGHVGIDPIEIDLMANGKQVFYEGFEDQLYLYRSSPIAGTGRGAVKMPIKPRPVLRLPWSLSFQISVVKNSLIDEIKLYNWFVAGGVQIGLGTYRPKFGRFAVDVWEKI